MKGVYHPAAIVSAIAFFLWGWLWYGVLFSKAWTALSGVSASSAQMTPAAGPYIIAAIVSLLYGYGTAIALSRGGNKTAGSGLSFALFFGIVFLASIMLEGYVFAMKPIALWAIDAGYAVSGLIICGLINGAWAPKGTSA
jgi:hypothetical protein